LAARNSSKNQSSRTGSLTTAHRDPHRDLDGDGRTDILWRNQAASGQVFAWFIDGTDRVGFGPLGGDSHEWKIVGNDDFDGQ
jgi:hypothetical protein